MPPLRVEIGAGVGVMPPLRSLVTSSTSAQVSGLTVLSVQ